MSNKIQVAFNQKYFDCDNKPWLITLENGQTILAKVLIIKDVPGIGIFDPNATIRKAWLEFEGKLTMIDDAVIIEKV